MPRISHKSEKSVAEGNYWNFSNGDLKPQTMRKNCWEVKACRKCTTILGNEACPVCKEVKLHEVHGGVNGGRACWTVPHTKCGCTTQEGFGSKFDNCKECDFYRMVMEELEESFRLQQRVISDLLSDTVL